ncbi:MAG: hypothetical protein LBD99_04255 [Candidatus Margulisbacteria bacterium]|jgi:hypothetical protein|nr:hypothetical protein [Candidatus Margulisiibacteriota bacterium]
MFNKLKKILERVQRFWQLKEILNKIPGEPKQKNYQEMTADEFYDFILAGGSQDDYYDFLLNFLLTGYLDGTIDEPKFRYFLGLNNPLQINRYVDKLLREAKMQGSLYEEMLKYHNSADKEDLLTLLMPERAKDRSRRQIANFSELQDMLKDSAEELQKQKQALAQARMLAEEKKRQEELRQAVILNSPEAGELLARDTFETEEKQIEQAAGILSKELEKQQKGTVLRQAINPAKHSVISEDTARMSPGELVAYKKRILSKMRRDINTSGGAKI